MAECEETINVIFRGTPITFNISKEKTKGKPNLGDFILCKACGERHIVRYGKEILEDGTQIASRKLAFVTCREDDYIVGINGKDVR